MFSSFQTFCVRYVAVRMAFRGPVGIQRKLGGQPSQYLLGKILYTMQTELIENLTCVGLRKTIIMYKHLSKNISVIL